MNRIQVKSRYKFINVVEDVPLDEDVGEPGQDKLNQNIEEVMGQGEALDSFSAKHRLNGVHYKLSARTEFELLICSLLIVIDRYRTISNHFYSN